MFRVGQKVVFVDDSDLDGSSVGSWEPGELPSLGSVYTVTRCFYGARFRANVVHLLEIKRSSKARQWWGDDVGYGARRFRPVVERKTDISIFKRMLQPTGPRVLEPGHGRL